MNLLRASLIANNLVQYYTDFKWQFDGAKNRFGQCDRRKKILSFSKPLTLLNNEEHFINIVLHEIAHALSPSRVGHGKIWKQNAVLIGCEPKRFYDNSVIQPREKYIGTCPECDNVVFRYRRTRIACGRCCKGVFSEEYLLIWNDGGK